MRKTYNKPFIGREIPGHPSFGLRFNYYRVVDDPEKIPGDQPSAGDLADDLRDIYVDLKSGLASFDAGDINQAEEDWRTSFYLHWGQHATNVISVLHKHGAPNA
ncbi:MAG: DUF5063 domain-containing protein [Candidatus Thiodiazotropha sp. (ex Lucinoma borealis)]|nr:DUF5063 domain-containing protein [Candidatus Thiodiazotropha sp. (ex Lucinoma borealis)]